MQRRPITASVFVVVLIVLSTAAALAASRNFRTHLTGDNERPVPVVTNAQGQAIFKVSKDGESLSFKLNVANIEDVTMAHLHLINRPDGNGPVVVWLYPSAPPPRLLPGRTQGTLAEGTITADDLVGLLAGESLETLLDYIEEGKIYVNVHTTAYPAGEIRGDLEHDH
jgi:hypothetical protein